MRKCKCEECGNVIKLFERPIQDENGFYYYRYEEPKFCHKCGSMLPVFAGYLNDIFKIYRLNSRLEDAKKLMLKSEYSSACRECFVVLENVIKRKSGIDSTHGADLVAKAFSFNVDKSTGDILKNPCIAINKLESESERNEQEGMMHMLMGFFRGPRNIYQHNRVRIGFNACFSILIQTSYFLNIICEEKSLLDKPSWQLIEVNYQEIYQKMPKLSDRIRYLLWCIKRGIYRPF